ncbi:MAG: aminotransferase class IV [Dehalococcoidia bacterium]|nr:aminotransferase class IV [Dehalococcoidia bacterium]MDH4367137.1 aminotransferase class IV [Dehalococcoidia bacterium]
MMDEFIYLNGQLVRGFEARLSPFDHGFLYGYGLFETMRSYNGHIFRLDSHLTRLRCSAESVGLTHSVLITDDGKQSLKAACVATLAANRLKDARIRLTVSAGEGDMTPDPRTCASPTVLITARNLDPLSPEKYETGFKAAVSFLRRNSQSPLSRLKSTCYMENILARTTARAVGCDEAIFLNEQGYLAEGSATNVFLVSHGELITPCFESGVLPGITRDAVLEIARTSNIKATERWVQLNELIEAEEAFLTNSILELVPLVSVEGRIIGTGKPGKLTGDLLFAYRRLVEEAVK